MGKLKNFVVIESCNKFFQLHSELFNFHIQFLTSNFSTLKFPTACKTKHEIGESISELFFRAVKFDASCLQQAVND